MASDLLSPGLALLGESVGMSTRKGIRPAPEDHVGSYNSGLVSIRRYGDYPGGGSVGTNQCGDWE